MPLKRIFISILACVMAFTLTTTAVESSSASGAESPPADLPLFAFSGLEYEGGFRLELVAGDTTLAYSPATIAMGSDGDSLFVESHEYDTAIAEYPMAELSMATELSELPIAGPPLQSFAPVLGRSPAGNPQDIDRIRGMLEVDGSLLVNGFNYYDAGGTRTATTLAIADATDLASSPVSDWADMNGAARAAGWMSPVPSEWQSELGATHISGSSSGFPIISRHSVGPSAYAVNLDPSLGGIGDAEQLLGFTLEQPLPADLSGTDDSWSFLSKAVYGFVVPGTSTYMTIGRSGGHESGVNYGPSPRGVGYHPNDLDDVSPYFWLWDMEDLVAVQNGAMEAHEVRPYEYGPFDLPMLDMDYGEWPDVGGAAFDPVSGLLYISLANTDYTQNIYSPLPVILAFSLGIDDTPVEPDPVEPDPVEPDPVEPDPVASAELCPAYTDSDLYRTRAGQVTVGPDEDWEQAIIDAPANTEILLEDGDYQMTRYAVYIEQADLTIRSASGNRDAVVIRGQGYGVGGEGLMVASERLTIADLSMTAIRNHAISIKPEAGASDVHIYNVNLVDNGTQHIKASAGGDNNNNNNGIVACSSIGYTADGVQGDYIGAIDIHRGVNWVIRDNYIYNVTGDGSGCEVDIDCGTYNSHPAILIWNESRDVVVERNVILDSWRALTLGLGTRVDGARVTNNFIYRTEDGDAGIELYDVHDAIIEHNTVFAPGYRGVLEFGGSSNLVIENNLLSAPPLDRPERGESTGVTTQGNIGDAVVGDLANPGESQLADGSRAIGAGVVSDVEIDIDGHDRAGRWDVGADQHAGEHSGGC